ncbi:MAG: DegT/DnrJ/EryC1/StrS aminotransferase family protein [Spirochaetia bacterium]|nr:DegT/DnrJ/EryC1/StrS aminotransferase family protein [Spirochaetia bacterium]
MLIPIDKPTLKRKDMAAVLQTMVDDAIGPGIYSSNFLTSLGTLLNTPSYSIALRTFSDAIYYALKALNLPPSSTIGVSALSPYIYKTVIERLGYTIHIFDIDEETKSVALEELTIHAHSIDALLLYEPFGILTPTEISDKEIPIILDISQSIGNMSTSGEQREGIDIFIMSFEMNDIISTAGGSALIINNNDMASFIKDELTLLYPYIALSDLNSALGIIQLANLSQNIAKRQGIYSVYQLAMSRNRHTPFHQFGIDQSIQGYSFLLIVEGRVEEAISFAKKYEVSTTLAFEQSIIKGQLEKYELYPHAIPIVLRTLRFPLYPFLSELDVKKVERVISQLP